MIEEGADNCVAIIGCAVRLPGAEDVDGFWSMVEHGRVSSRLLSRTEIVARGVPTEVEAKPNFVPVVNDLDGHRSFDARFFGFTDREAEIMDPQRRLLFETVWRAFEDAGQVPSRLRTGAWLSTGQSEYFLLNLASRPELFEQLGGVVLATLNGQDFTATQIAYKLDLRGPAINVNTACSSSLVAVHQAAEALLARECDLAVAGGASLALSEENGYRYRDGGITSRTGQCRPFDHRADGTISGNGAAAVVLKRLTDALEAADPIRAVILGTAINNDGRRKVGYTAPSVEGQAEVIAEALAVAGLKPCEVDYLETHGTGTSLGDAIEVQGLAEVFGADARHAPLWLGSTKANVGHCNAAAGATSLIKAVMSLEREIIPPLAGFEAPNASIDLDRGQLAAPDRPRAWPRSERPRVVGVSSFGIGGTNAHVVLGEAPLRPPAAPSLRPQVLPISAMSDDRLAVLADQIAAAVDSAPPSRHPDMAYTLAVGRREMPWRACAVGRTGGLLVEAVRARPPARIAAAEDLPTAIMIAGQGEPFVGIFQRLHATEPAFREAVDACRAILAKTSGGLDATDWRWLTAPDASDTQFRDTRVHQPLLFVFHYALCRLWSSWGVKPAYLLGHSHGEFVAAHMAGALSLEDALRLMVSRGEMMSALPPGGMLAVACGEAFARRIAAETGTAIAARNGPGAVVLSGAPDQIAAAEALVSASDGASRRLALDHAFHSPSVAAGLGSFRAALEAVRFAPLEIPVLSNVTGECLPVGHVFTSDYWLDHARSPVRFADGLATLASLGSVRILEIGARSVLTKLAARSGLLREENILIAPPDDDADLLPYRRLADYWTSGGAVDWDAFHSIERRRKEHLPLYPFAREEHWIERRGPARSAAASVAGWLYRPTWRRRDPPEPKAAGDAWLVVGQESPGCIQLCALIENEGVTCLRMSPSSQYRFENHGGQFDVADREHLSRLATDLRKGGFHVDRVVWFAGDDRRRPDEAVAGIAAFGDLLLRPLTESGPLVFGVVTPAEDPNDNAAARGDRAASAAALRVLPQEVSGLRTRVIAAHPGAAPDALAAAMGGDRAFESLRLGAEATEALDYEALSSELDGADDFREGGRYLFVGGLGKVGRILTERLTREMPMSATVVGRLPLPEGLGFSTVDCARPSLDAAAMRDIAQTVARSNHPRVDLAQPGRLLRLLAARLVLDHMRSLGLSAAPGAILEREATANAVCAVPALRRIARAFARTLVEAGVAEDAPQGVRLLNAAADLDDCEAYVEAIAREHPDFAGAAKRLEACGRRFADTLLRGVPGIEVLYPGGSPEFLNSTAPGPKASASFEKSAQALAALLRARIEAEPGRTIRILEIGGGTGSLTQSIVSTLLDRNAQYCFTDISPAFLQEARRQARRAKLDRFEVRRLDITRHPLDQDFGCGEFDCIIGFNTLHLAPDLEEAVARLSSLLRPDGLFAIIETVQWAPWTELVWGTTEEWWAYTDARRNGDGPLLSAETWTGLFSSLGFAVVGASAGGDDESERLLFAFGPDPSLVQKGLAPVGRFQEAVDHLRAMGRAGGAVRYCRADMTHRNDVEALATLLEREPPLDGVVYAATTGGRSLGLVGEISAANITAEFNAKAVGLSNLALVATAARSRFVAVMSSMSAVLGGIGHIGYAAANAWQDAYCAALAGDARWLATNWDAWSHADKSVGASVHANLMSEQEAVAAFRAALRTKIRGQILVSRTDLRARLESWLWPRVAAEPAPVAAAASASDAESALAQIWRELLGARAPADLGANFFALGGDSLLAVQLLSRLKARLEISVSLADFMRNPTFGGLASAAASREERWDRVVTLQRDGDAPPLYCIHPGGGGIQCYRALAEALGGTAPVHAILSNRHGPPDLALHESIEGMAQDYAAAIRRVHRGGPVVLLGYCFGGMIAFEVARQLAHAGVEAGPLILIDSHPPGVDDGYFDERVFLATQLDAVPVVSATREWLKTLSGLAPEVQAHSITDRLDWSRLDSSMREPARRTIHEIILFNKAKNVYSPKGRLRGEVYLMRIDDANFHLNNNDIPDLGWSRHVEGPLDVWWLSKPHERLLDEGSVASVAERVRHILAAVPGRAA